MSVDPPYGQHMLAMPPPTRWKEKANRLWLVRRVESVPGDARYTPKRQEVHNKTWLHLSDRVSRTISAIPRHFSFHVLDIK